MSCFGLDSCLVSDQILKRFLISPLSSCFFALEYLVLVSCTFLFRTFTGYNYKFGIGHKRVYSDTDYYKSETYILNLLTSLQPLLFHYLVINLFSVIIWSCLASQSATLKLLEARQIEITGPFNTIQLVMPLQYSSFSFLLFSMSDCLMVSVKTWCPVIDNNNNINNNLLLYKHIYN